MKKDNFLKHPPMGWNSYDYFDTTVNEEEVRANAEYMAKHLKDYGYTYVVVDIQWYAHQAGSDRNHHQYLPFSRVEMDEWGRLLPCPERFPSSKEKKGFLPLAEYVHSLGLKFGIHIMRGIPRRAVYENCTILNTKVKADQVANPYSICGWNPDMYGLYDQKESQAYYDSIVQLYASWGVDYIKCDDICNTNLYKENPYSARREIEMLSSAIASSKREIVLSLSPGPAIVEEAWHLKTHANMWRITDDFWDDWRLLKEMFLRCERWQDHVKEGSYPDCDMLPVGKLGKGFGQERDSQFTLEEQKTMMSLWCFFRSPLMIGADLTQLQDETLSLLTNQSLLTLLEEGYQGKQLLRTDQEAIWISENEEKKEVYLALFNLMDETRELTFSQEMILQLTKNQDWEEGELTELWSKEVLQTTERGIEIKVVAHGVVVYQLPTGREQNHLEDAYLDN